GQADRKRKHAWHQMEAEEAERERHAAVARAVAGVDHSDQCVGRWKDGLEVRLVVSEGSHEDDLRDGLQRGAKEAGTSLPLEPVRLVPVAPHSCFADGARIQHEEAIATQGRNRLLRSARGDDPEAGRYVAEHRHAEPSLLMANEVRHALELAKD